MSMIQLEPASVAPAAPPDGEQVLPTLTIEGPPVDAARCIEPGTGRAKAWALILTLVGFLFLTIATYGITLLVLVLFPFVEVRQGRRALALIHGSGIRIWRHQLPQVHDCVASYTRRLGLKTVPEVYLVEANILNAAAVKHGKNDVILLTDDMIDACLRSGDPRSLSFVLAHEMAHVALGHCSRLRAYLRTIHKKLSRLDELSADRVALRLVGDAGLALRGLMVLATGPAILRFVDQRAVLQQVQAVVADRYSLKAEKTLTHPLLLRRISRIPTSPTAAPALPNRSPQNAGAPGPEAQIQYPGGA